MTLGHRLLAARLALATVARVRLLRDSAGRRAAWKVAATVDRTGFILDPRGRGQTAMSAYPEARPGRGPEPPLYETPVFAKDRSG